jgi:hypothetical protein
VLEGGLEGGRKFTKGQYSNAMANQVLHEAIYRGLLNQYDNPFAEVGTLGFVRSSYDKMIKLSPDECNQIRRRLGVK